MYAEAVELYEGPNIQKSESLNWEPHSSKIIYILTIQQG